MEKRDRKIDSTIYYKKSTFVLSQVCLTCPRNLTANAFSPSLWLGEITPCNTNEYKLKINTRKKV